MKYSIIKLFNLSEEPEDIFNESAKNVYQKRLKCFNCEKDTLISILEDKIVTDICQMCKSYNFSVSSRYLLEQVITSGGFGIVGKCYDVKTKRMINFKSKKQSTSLKDWDNEIKFKKYVSKIPFIRTDLYLDDTIDKYSKKNYIFSEWIEANLISHHFTSLLSPLDFYKVILDCLIQLYILHSFGVIHRDIKPDNILITKKKDNWDPQIYLIDFGSSSFDSTPQHERPKTLSIDYSAPEFNINDSFLSDVYSLGVVFTHLSNGVQHLDQRILSIISKMTLSQINERISIDDCIHSLFNLFLDPQFDFGEMGVQEKEENSKIIQIEKNKRLFFQEKSFSFKNLKTEITNELKAQLVPSSSVHPIPFIEEKEAKIQINSQNFFNFSKEQLFHQIEQLKKENLKLKNEKKKTKNKNTK